ncbi:DNA-packaging protein gp3 [Bacillus oleivorans]|uniref:DNA-packaging protein gp3 n=1 Tax=Bacillus oleivorans TaxID=1448271 RepID=A0A285D6C1_9BACI|nr:terminase small subunit [Bacillus oleivorans]SNX75329.1 DNA-packaging protein gp3 [Bacillus oleivorans]
MSRPLMFGCKEELEEKISAYFYMCDTHMQTMFTKEGQEISVPAPKPYTISGLAHFLGTNRQTLLNYEERDEFFDTIKRAKAKIEAFVEESLWTPKVTAGVIFNLKNNFGWVDKSELQQSGETTHNIKTDKDLSNLTVEELKQLENILNKTSDTE